jgi:ABC-type multidrug transport system fused ATPase/permease subunit
MNFFSYLKIITKNNFFLVIANFLIILSGAIIEMGSLLVIAPIIDYIINLENKSAITTAFNIFFSNFDIVPTLSFLFIIYFLVVLFKSAFEVFSNRLMLLIKYSVVKKIIFKTYYLIFDSSWQFFVNEKFGKLISTFTKEINGIGDTISFVGRMFSGIVKIAILILLPILISWKVSLACFGFGFLAALPLLFLSKYSITLGKKELHTSNEYVSLLHENFNLAKIIISFGCQKKTLETLKLKFKDHIKAAINFGNFNLLIGNLYLPIAVAGVLIIYYVGRYFLLPLSDIAIIFISYYKIIPSIREIITAKNNIDNSYPAFNQILELQKKAIKLKNQHGQGKFLGFSKFLEFKNVNFSYNNNEKIINNMSFVINKGEFVAFVGASGSGKTTIIDLIMGLNSPSNGKIFVDGVSLDYYEINSYRKKISYIPQTNLLINTSIYENIKWDCELATKDDVERIAKKVGAHDFILSLESGYNTNVGERGIRLSGGQSQKISLARALIKNPDILILDEATSSLDGDSEIKIKEILDNNFSFKTIIAIAHRLTTIQKANKIFLISNGCIVEEGNFNSLVSRSKIFKKMVDQQVFGE